MSGWPTKPLGELCEVLDRYRKPITKSDRRTGPYPYYGAMGVVDYVDGYLFDEPLILLGEDGAKWGAGELCAFKASGRYWVNNHAHIMRPDRTQVLDDWLVYFLCGADLMPFITGLTVPKLNQERMRAIPVPVPSIEEQRRIVGVLDEAFAASATATVNAQKNLANAKSLYLADVNRQFERISDSSLRTFKELSKDVLVGLIKPSREQSPDLEFPYLKMNNIGLFGEFCASPMAYVSASPKEVKKFLVKDGDFLFNTRNSKELVGKHCIFPAGAHANAIFNNNIMRVRFASDVDPEFVSHMFCAGTVQRQLEAMKSGTTSVFAIYQSQIMALPVPCPSFDVQREIAAKLNECRALTHELEGIYRSKLECLKQLKQSLLSRAFTGELAAAVLETIAA